MALNPNIILQGKTPTFDAPDPMAQYGKALQLKGLLTQNQLQDQQIADDQATRLAFKNSDGDPNTVLKSLLSNGNYKAAQALQKQITDQEKAKADIGYKTAQTGNLQGDIANKAIAQHRDALSYVSTPEDAAAWVKAGYDDPVTGKILGSLMPLDQAVQRIPTDPVLFQQWKQQAALGATKYIEQNKPTYQTRNTGGTTDTLQLPGLGGAPTVVSSIRNTQSPDSIAADARQRASVPSGTSAPGTPDQTTENIAQMIASGRMAPLGQMALRSPQGMQIMARVQEINPNFRAQDFTTGSKAEKDYATGKQGNTVRSFNVALTHLDTLSNLADALDNGNVQMVNKIGNAVASQTGGSAPTNFDAAKKIVADEIVKAIVGSGGGVGDREEAARVISSANSPAQLKGVIGTYKELMAGQLHGLNDQYKASTGRDDFEKYLSPEARSYVASKKPKANTEPINSAPVPIKTADDYNKLPSGATYIDPTGKTRRKP